MTSAVITRGATGVSFDTSSAKGRFSAIRIVAKDGGTLELTKLQIAYSDCHLQEEQSRISVSPGRRSEAIPLQKNDRFIDRIGIELRAPSPHNTTIVVEGLQNEGGEAAVRRPSLQIALPRYPPLHSRWTWPWGFLGLILSSFGAHSISIHPKPCRHCTRVRPGTVHWIGWLSTNFNCGRLKAMSLLGD